MNCVVRIKAFFSKLRKNGNKTAHQIHSNEDYEIKDKERFQSFRDVLRADGSTDDIQNKSNGTLNSNPLLVFLKTRCCLVVCGLFFAFALILLYKNISLSKEIESLENRIKHHEYTISQYRSTCAELEEKVDEMEDEMQKINSLVSDIDDDLSDIQTDLILGMPYMIYNEISSIESSLSDVEYISGQY